MLEKHVYILNKFDLKKKYMFHKKKVVHILNLN